MNYEAVTNAILKYMGKKPSDHGAYTDLLSACRQWAVSYTHLTLPTTERV